MGACKAWRAASDKERLWWPKISTLPTQHVEHVRRSFQTLPLTSRTLLRETVVARQCYAEQLRLFGESVYAIVEVVPTVGTTGDGEQQHASGDADNGDAKQNATGAAVLRITCPAISLANVGVVCNFASRSTYQTFQFRPKQQWPMRVMSKASAAAFGISATAAGPAASISTFSFDLPLVVPKDDMFKEVLPGTVIDQSDVMSIMIGLRAEKILDSNEDDGEKYYSISWHNVDHFDLGRFIRGDSSMQLVLLRDMVENNDLEDFEFDRLLDGRPDVK